MSVQKPFYEAIAYFYMILKALLNIYFHTSLPFQYKECAELNGQEGLMSKIINIVPQHIDSIDQIHKCFKKECHYKHTPSRSPASKKVGLYLSHNDMPEKTYIKDTYIS